jgi:hypothetical protein
MLTRDPILTQAIEKQHRARIQKEAETTRLLRQLATQDNPIEVQLVTTPTGWLKGLIQTCARFLHIHRDLLRQPRMAER